MEMSERTGALRMGTCGAGGEGSQKEPGWRTRLDKDLPVRGQQRVSHVNPPDARLG